MSEHRRTSGLRSRAVRTVATIPAHLLLGLIWVYRHTLSPVLPAVFGPACGCRFHPTCAVYAAEAVRVHGAWRGAWLAARRLLKCHPLHPGGYDPVPPLPGQSLVNSRSRPTVRRVRGTPRPFAAAVVRHPAPPVRRSAR